MTPQLIDRHMLPALCPVRLPFPTAWTRGAVVALMLGMAGSTVLAASADETTEKAGTAHKAAKSAPSSKATKPAKAAKISKVDAARLRLESEASGLALAAITVEAISNVQLDIATRVLTGDVDCEFNQRITVLPVPGEPGHFHVNHKKQQYRMVPQETSTGAVRLEDKTAGIVWLQIPSKSMLMNARLGQRMVDACTNPQQRAALIAAVGAATSLGIIAPPVPAAAAASATQTDAAAALAAAPPAAAVAVPMAPPVVAAAVSAAASATR
jgi:hypothetical protein